VLSLLKSALGTPQIPPGQVVTGLALILSNRPTGGTW
jgi:flagellar biosynthesis protein FliP